MAPLALVLLACEDDDFCPRGVTAEISGNHGHALEVPGDAVKRAVGGVYPLKGGTHEHAVPVKDADFEKLKNGDTATTRSTSVNAHMHEVDLTCPKSE